MNIICGLLSINPVLLNINPPEVAIIMITQDNYQMVTEDNELMITEDS